jgi:predicted RNase H-like HicB family nuclease
MNYYSFEIVVEREPEDGGYLAYSPTLPGCFSNGQTMEEAMLHMREAVQQHVTSLLERGQGVPQNERLVHVEALTIGVPA